MVMRTPEEQKVWQTAKRFYFLLAISPHVGRCVGANRSLNLKPRFLLCEHRYARPCRMQRNAVSAQPVALRSVYRFSLLTISCLSPCYYLSCQLRRKSNVSIYCIRFDPAENRTGTAEVDTKRFSH